MGELTTEKALGQAIQSARQAAGLTQQDLCHQAGLSYSTLAKIERGAIKTPSVFTVFKVAEVLHKSMDELLGTVVDAEFGTKFSKKKSKNGISFLYLDINGCLVRFFHGAFTQISQDTGVSSDKIETAFWHYNDSVCSGDIMLEEFNERIAKQIGVKQLDWEKYYMQAVEPISEMHEVVRWAVKGFRVGLLSNIMPGFIDSMIERGILPDVKYDAIVDSSEVKAIKPDEEIYEIAQKKAGVPADEILFVDDSRTNLIAAERQGWKVMWFDDFHLKQSTDKIRSALEV